MWLPPQAFRLRPPHPLPHLKTPQSATRGQTFSFTARLDEMVGEMGTWRIVK